MTRQLLKYTLRMAHLPSPKAEQTIISFLALCIAVALMFAQSVVTMMNGLA
jgi:hypothetical protein